MRGAYLKSENSLRTYSSAKARGIKRELTNRKTKLLLPTADSPILSVLVLIDKGAREIPRRTSLNDVVFDISVIHCVLGV